MKSATRTLGNDTDSPAMEHLADAAHRSVDRAARKGREYLRKEPLRGAGIVAGVALAAGALLGAVLLRR